MARKLLAADADPDARDGESGWSSLHRALYFGHLSIASVLLQAGASLTLEDSKCRTPIDLISGPVSLAVGGCIWFSGQAAVITLWQVTFGLCSCRVWVEIWLAWVEI